MIVFQIQLTKQPSAVPQTRDYIFDEERKLISQEDKLKYFFDSYNGYKTLI